MKVIELHNHLLKLIDKSMQQDREAQREIFDLYSPKMLGVCRQYVKDDFHAEDMMSAGFLKVFLNLHTFRRTGSFEGWIRRIMVNTCLTYLRKKVVFEFTDDDYAFGELATYNMENTHVADIQALIDTLPDGYKLVFNLYAIEGYKHAEIAKRLQISESTSKSQLFKARKWLQKKYTKLNQLEHEGR
ncbi:RNA polymerase sigma factor [Tenacibaculum sp. SG-28]|uniref:RNA polymerase sigma factor n=1 Tax=Tenacibaculum sp. SG-28 TaxID=754426 RepID=UPI000CF43286|nr:sigma-70 family RNA polymerase sigma factor [Tenacibaculum sp. SG-28]PQJ23325.1 RNA polymerase subunit sigma-70 [Tenacibaculum sp. SG-28]